MAVQQKRIAHLDPAVDPDHSVDIVTEIISSQSEAEKWALPVDYVKTEDDPDPDRGTKRVPLNRVALLTESGLVPASMLPSYISTVKRGKMEVSGTKWTFTEEDTGKKYVCPVAPEAGEETPSIDCIYADTGNTSSQTPSDDYYQYRFVPAEGSSPNNTGNFVPIPSDLIVKDGEGTKVTDNLTNYTRQIDVNIDSPVNPGQDGNPLLISGGKLCHAKFLGNSASYPSSSTTTPGFGGTFYVPSLTVNGTGHVTAGSTTAITMPDNAATTSAAGLVKIGTNIRPIDSNWDPGTTTGNPYVYVAAADHVHSAATMTLANTNVPNKNTIQYNGTDDIYYDTRYTLRAELPRSAPSDGDVLSVTAVEGGQDPGAFQAVWVSPNIAVTPVYLFAPVGTGQVANSAATIPLSAATDANVLSISSNAITGIRANKTYMISYSISVQTQSAGSNLVDFTIGAKIGSGTALVNKHILDESIYGATGALFPQWINGTIFVHTDSTGNLTIEGSIPAGVTWRYTGGTVQVAEVK